MLKEKKREKKSSDIVFFVIMLFLCVCILELARKDVPSFFGYRILNVISSSMEPEIETGSYIIIKETDSESLMIGDIITFVSKEPAIYGMYNTHRIYDICKDTYTGEKLFITKGDAHQDTDTYPVYGNEIVGKVVKVLPFGKTIGKVVTHFANNRVYLGIIMVFLGLCLVSYVIQFIKAVLDKEV